MDLVKTIIAVLVALGLGAGGALYYSDGSEVPPQDLDVICAQWQPPITVNSCSGICVTNSMELKDKGIKLDINGNIELTSELGEKESFTKDQILNFKTLEIK